jgi:two-component system, cell cycle sensor histidine kinase and response regulator CckA
MISVGAFDVSAGALQLVVPSYGLRLVRRFGVQRVGWFLVVAFATLASLHLLEPVGPSGRGFGPDFALNVVYTAGSVLLLIGMGHMHTFFSQHERARCSEENLNEQWQEQVEKKTTHLTRANEALQQEITRRQHAEALLQESEAQYRFLFTENPQPMWVFDLEQCRFLVVNKAALRQYGYSPDEFMRLTPQDLLPSEQVEAFTRELSQSCAHAESRSSWQHYRKDQTLIDVELSLRDLSYSGVPVRLAVIQDLTQRRRRESEAFQASKMEMIARVSGGAAHRFNDVLSVIESHVALLRQSVKDVAATEQLQEISVASTRGTNLGYQMLSTGGRQLMQPRPLDLNRLITNLSLILRRVAGEKVLFQNLVGRTPVPIIGDPKVIENVLISLVKNARDAMPEKGTVSVNTSVVQVSKPPIRQDPESAALQFVRISVRDTGCGMTPEVQEHLFEPFFTTKGPDKGQGLGLACVFGAVRQHWGWIEYTTAAGSGTEFRIFLPCISESLLPSVSEIQASTTVNRGTVLLVDPDDRSRGVARYVLNRNGYRVIEADSSSIALVLWEGQARQVDLVLTDIALAGSSGFDFANQLRQSRPDLKVIFACGNEAELKNQQASSPDDIKWVAKPYRSDQLAETVEGMLLARQG